MNRIAMAVLALLAGAAVIRAQATGMLTVDGMGVKLSHVSTRTDELLGKRFSTVILTEAPVPASAVQKDTIYQLAYQKAIQGIRLRFDEDRKLNGVILYHSTIMGPSVEYQGFAQFAVRASAPGTIAGTVTMDYKDTDGRTIKIDASFETPLPK